MRRRWLAVLTLASMLLAPGVAGAGESLRERQWGLDRVRAPETWALTQGKGTVVAVVDTGVDLDHPDLAPRLLRDDDGEVVGLDLVDGGPPQDRHGHGTQVAGLIAAAGEAPGDLTGVAPEASIMPVRVLDERGAGSGADIDEGIRWAVDNGADVINLSLESAVPLPGQVVTTGPDRAVRYAWDNGVTVVAAAGNSGTPFSDYPASSPVLLVGATDADDRRAAFSDGGRSDMVLAPGVDVMTSSCDPCGDESRPTHREVTGTSFAAPHVAGAAALLLAHGWDHERAVAALRDSAVEVAGGGVGGSDRGRIDVAAALGIEPRTTASADEGSEENGDADGNGDEGDGGSGADGSGDGAGRSGEPEDGGGDDAPAEDGTDGSEPQRDDAEASEEPESPAPEPEDEPSDGDEGEPEIDDTPPAGSADRDVGRADEVALPAETPTSGRAGLVTGVAAGLVGISATAVVVAARRWPLLWPFAD